MPAAPETPPETVITLPAGSTSNNISTTGSLEYVSASIINGLADAQSTSSITFSNSTSATTANLIIMLKKLTPTGSPSSIAISNGTSQYVNEVSNTNSDKRIEFVNIPTTFLASFTIKNQLGVSIQADGNSIIIIPN